MVTGVAWLVYHDEEHGIWQVFGYAYVERVLSDPGAFSSDSSEIMPAQRTHGRGARPRFPLPKERGLEIATAFFAASRHGDMQRLRSLLAEDVTVYADGGGKVRAALEPIVGIDAVLQVHATLAPIFAAHMSQLARYGFVNGLPGFVTIEQGDTLQTTALQIEDDKIVAIYVTRNPDKLRHLESQPG